MAQAGVPINHLTNRYRDYRSYVGSAKGTIGILHLGVVDCSPRPIPWFARNQIGKLPSFVRNRIIGFLASAPAFAASLIIRSAVLISFS